MLQSHGVQPSNNKEGNGSYIFALIIRIIAIIKVALVVIMIMKTITTHGRGGIMLRVR